MCILVDWGLFFDDCEVLGVVCECLQANFVGILGDCWLIGGDCEVLRVDCDCLWAGFVGLCGCVYVDCGLFYDGCGCVEG